MFEQIKQMEKHAYNKLYLTTAVCLLSVLCVIVAATPQATGYEYSIYEMYSPLFWIVAGVIFLLPLLYLYLTRQDDKQFRFDFKTANRLLIISGLTLLLLLSMPFARGYVAITSGDALAHIGYAVDIMNTGYFPTGDHYPLIHVLLSLLSTLPGVSLYSLPVCFVQIFSIPSILSVYCLTRALKFSKRHVVAITSLFILPILGYWFMFDPVSPSTNGWQLIPLYLLVVFYLGFTIQNNRRYLILALILSAAFWYLHPETVLFPALMLGFTFVFCLAYNIYHKNGKYAINYMPLLSVLAFLVIGFILFFTSTPTGVSQFTYYSTILSNILDTVIPYLIIGLIVLWIALIAGQYLKNTILSKIKNTRLILTVTAIGIISIILIGLCLILTDVTILTSNPFYDILFGEKSPFNSWFSSSSDFSRKFIILMEQYGQLVILSALCLVTSIYYIIQFRKKGLDKRYLLIGMLFFTFVLVAVIFIMLGTAIGEYIFRQYKYPTIFGVFILGLAFIDVVCKMKTDTLHKIFSLCLVLGIVCMAVCGMVNFFRSSGIGYYNNQVTNEDVAIMDSVFDFRNEKYLIEESGRQHQMRYNTYLYGHTYAGTMPNIRGIYDKNLNPPENFGYDTHMTLGDSYTTNTYYLQSPTYGTFTRWLFDYEEWWNWHHSLYPTEWERIQYDNTVNRIMTGGTINFYLIIPN